MANIISEENIFYTLPEIWDFCVSKIYNKEKFIKGFIEFLNLHTISEEDLILDAGCGSGFPALDLRERGFYVIGVDKSNEMIKQIKTNAYKRGISIEIYHLMWSDLSSKFNSVFKLVYCRGNSLVYAASWEQNWIHPKRSIEEIKNALYNFYQVLDKKGILYIDVTHKKEKPHKRNIGKVYTNYGPVNITWEIKHDTKNKIRTWVATLDILDLHRELTFQSYSYLIDHRELVDIVKKIGFSSIEETKIKGENNYTVYMAKK